MAKGRYALGLPEAISAIIPGDGGTQRLARLVGSNRAIELILTGHLCDADKAERLGLISRAVDSDGVMDEAMALAKQMAQQPPLSIAVAVGNPREYTKAEKENQEIAESCNRLIKNTIICWNYLYLSKKIIQAESDEIKDRIKAPIVTHSVVSWRHLNLLGEYDFSDEKLQETVGILSPKLAA